MKDWFNRLAQLAADLVMALIPRPRPTLAAIVKCRIVSHRGQHDNNRSARENTMQAFERARAGGVWGIEADIRWTADLVPVIIHDPDTVRIFGEPVTIRDVTFEQLRAAVPEVPSLAELVASFGGDTHLMLELKAEEFPHIGRQRQILREHLAGLKSGNDYHIMALDPALFETFDIEPRKCCLSIALADMRAISRKTLGTDYGGITGHYVLLSERIRQSHEGEGRKVGTGFVASRNALCREINREVEWIFSNRAVAMQKIANRLAARQGPISERSEA